jgi:hypothetical protein
MNLKKKLLFSIFTFFGLEALFYKNHEISNNYCNVAPISDVKIYILNKNESFSSEDTINVTRNVINVKKIDLSQKLHPESIHSKIVC